MPPLLRALLLHLVAAYLLGTCGMPPIWPEGKVPYFIHSGFTRRQRAMILDAIQVSSFLTSNYVSIYIEGQGYRLI